MRLLRPSDALNAQTRARSRALARPVRHFAAGVRYFAALLSPALTLALSLTAPAAAQDTIPAYAADAVYRAPDGTESTGRVVKSGPNMRLEFAEAGRPVIQIIRRAEGLMYVLDPGTRSYFKVQGEPDPTAGSAAYQPPCDQNDPSLLCRFLGNEVTSGITTELWELGQPGDPSQVSRILWDGARQRVLRQESPGGTVMTLAFSAMEQIAGRTVEHWIITVTVPGQPTKTGAWYYDPELRVELREELPEGPKRSLENVVVGPVDPAAFEPPAGWTEIAPPAPPGPGGSGVPTPPSAN
ncbi:MAG: hypothetical protein KDK10_01710 [Maritimibacter sp.]|nr:hypothetical protein [Maritimibacter sp.]